MKKVLFLSSRLPYPPIGGDRLKNYWLLNILTKHFKVHLVSITKDDVPNDFYKWASSIGITYKIFKKQRYEFYWNTLKRFFNGLPLQVNYYYFDDIQRYINVIYDDYDILFATLIRTAKYFMKINKKPKILDMADAISINYEYSADNTSSVLWKLLYRIESKKLREFERESIYTFDKTLFFNKEEEIVFDMGSKTLWIPHGVDERLFGYNLINSKYQRYVAFFGKMNYQPNVDAVLWFVNNVFSKINKDLKFIIVGAYPTQQIVNLAKKNNRIYVTGYIDDPYLILKSSLCVIAPMQTGGGIQNKILESMALGTINIVSSLAARPISKAQNYKHFIIEDNPDKIAYIINDIYQHPMKYESIKENAKNFIKNNFTWAIYEKKLLKVINKLIGDF